MIRTALALCFTFGIIVFSATSGMCQEANPLAVPYPPPRVGVEAGISVNQQQGSLEADCGCTYTSGNGSGVTINGLFERFVGYQWSLVGRVGVRTISISATGTKDTFQVVYNPQTRTSTAMEIPLSEQGATNLSYITLTPTARYDITDNLFAEAGPSLGFLLSSKLVATESPSQNGTAFLNGGSTYQVQNGPIANVSSFNLSLLGALGYTLHLKNRLMVSPEVSVMLPLTSVQSSLGWKVMTYQLTAAITWAIHP